MDSLPIINSTYDLYKELIKINYDLSKRWRYSLGQHTENSILTLLELFIMSKEAPKTLKLPYLLKANATLEIVRLKLRLYLELQLVNETRVFQIQNNISEIGRMLGGWMKAVQST